MRKVAFVAVLTLVMSGCAATSQYGNHLVDPARLDQSQLATEAVNQLTALYPPAKSRFELQQPTPDAFGQLLVNGLRSKGYAVLELDGTAIGASTPETEQVQEPIVQVQNPVQSYPLRYVVDSAGDSNLYRMTLLVGGQSLTRPYLYQSGQLLPAGYWLRKE